MLGGFFGGSSDAVRAGGAFVEIGTKDSKLVKGLQSANKKLSFWAKGLSALAASIAAPLAIATKSFGSWGDTVAKMSRRTGASVEFLSEMGYVAGLAGQSVEQMEMALRGLGRVSLDLARGQGEATEAMKMLGLEGKEIARMPVEEQLTTILTQLGKVEDDSIKAGIAMRLFGRAGSALIPVADMGADAIARFRDEARVLGISLSSDVSVNAEDVVDWGYRIQQSWQGLKNTIGNILTPAFIELSQYITAMIVTGRLILEQNPQIIESMVGLAKTVLYVASTAIILKAALTMTNPIMMAAVALIALGDALGIVDTGFGNVLRSIKLGQQSIMGWIEMVGDGMVGFGYTVYAAFANLFDKLVEKLYSAIMEIRGAYEKTKSWIASKLGMKSDEEHAARVAQIDERKSAYKEGLSNWYSERTEGRKGTLEAIMGDAIVRRDEDREQIKENDIIGKWGSMFDNVLGEIKDFSVPAPEGPEVSPIAIPATSPALGVAGFFGGSAIGENIGQLATSGKTIEKEQLEVQKGMLDKLENISEKTESAQPTYK